MYNFKFILLLIFIIFFTNSSNSQIQIKYKIGDEIITNIDILNERNYLIFLRPKLGDLPDNEINKISKNSLIKEIIKKKELKKVFKKTNDIKYIDKIKQNLFSYKEVSSEEEFLNLLKKYELNNEKIIEKIKYEGLLNQLIITKYGSLIKIDENKLRNKLISKNSKEMNFEYNLSEILFEIDENEKFEIKLKEIKNYINSNNFKSAATKYSISNSANKGGQIGWIKETLLSDKLNKILKKLNKNQITDPIKYPNGYLLLKINDKKEIKQRFNLDKELEESIIFEKNKQLNQYSLLYYKKLKQNTIINEK